MMGVEKICEALSNQGYCVIEQALPADVAQALLAEVNKTQGYSAAGIGRGSHHQKNTSIRSDRIAWIEGESAAQRMWLELMESLRVALNERLFLGLFAYESHYAHYAPGSFYQKHLDAFRGQSNRVLSTVTYLNEHWEPSWGGELLLYGDGVSADQAEVLERVVPSLGTMVIFLSEAFPHEVLPARHDRYSIAGWFRVNGSTTRRVDPND